MSFDTDPLFWSKVDIRGLNECWEWRAGRDRDGYGHVKRQRKQWGAHRWAYTITKGPILDGLQIDHLCRNRGCVNPHHLDAVTPRENTLRSPIAGAAVNAAKTKCPSGHPLAGENLRVTLRPAGRTERTCRTCANAASRRRYRSRVGV